jgi:hypothetical protein
MPDYMGLVLQSNGLKADGKSYLDMSIDSNAYNPVINRQNQCPLPVYSNDSEKQATRSYVEQHRTFKVCHNWLTYLKNATEHNW